MRPTRKSSTARGRSWTIRRPRAAAESRAPMPERRSSRRRLSTRADHSPEKSRPAFYPCFLQTALPWVTGALLHAVRRISPQHSYQCDRDRASLSTDSNTRTRPRLWARKDSPVPQSFHRSPEKSRMPACGDPDIRRLASICFRAGRLESLSVHHCENSAAAPLPL